MRRTLNTINMAVTTFYSQIPFYPRLLCAPGPPTAPYRQAVQYLTEIIRKQHASDPRLLRRLHWPLLAAAIEAEDAVQREWLRQRLSELRGFHTECLWAHDITELVLARQDASVEDYVDLGAILRAYSHTINS